MLRFCTLSKQETHIQANMKKILLTTLLTLFAAAAFAQRGSVTATVVNADTGESVAGAVLIVAPAKTPGKTTGLHLGF